MKLNILQHAGYTAEISGNRQSWRLVQHCMRLILLQLWISTDLLEIECCDTDEHQSACTTISAQDQMC